MDVLRRFHHGRGDRAVPGAPRPDRGEVDTFAHLVSAARPHVFPAQEAGGVDGLTLGYVIAHGVLVRWIPAYPGGMSASASAPTTSIPMRSMQVAYDTRERRVAGGGSRQGRGRADASCPRQPGRFRPTGPKPTRRATVSCGWRVPDRSWRPCTHEPAGRMSLTSCRLLRRRPDALVAVGLVPAGPPPDRWRPVRPTSGPMSALPEDVEQFPHPYDLTAPELVEGPAKAGREGVEAVVAQCAEKLVAPYGVSLGGVDDPHEKTRRFANPHHDAASLAHCEPTTTAKGCDSGTTGPCTASPPGIRSRVARTRTRPGASPSPVGRSPRSLAPSPPMPCARSERTPHQEGGGGERP